MPLNDEDIYLLTAGFVLCLTLAVVMTKFNLRLEF